MDADICIFMLYMGVFSMLICIGNLISMIISFVVYKRNNGRLNFWQFAKRWNI